LPELCSYGRRVGQRRGHNIEIARADSVFDLRGAVTEVATVFLSRVVEMVNGASDRPPDFERNNSGNRRPSVACYSVLEVPVILDVEILHFKGCGAIDQVNLDSFWVENDCPEESIAPDARVKIMDLGTPQLGVIDVNSDKTESSIPDVAISSPVNALHEGHVIALRRQIRLDSTCFPVGLGRSRINKTDARVTLEVPNRSQVGIGPGNWWNLHVNVHAKSVQRGGHG